MNVGARTVVTFIQRSAMVWAKRRTSNWFVKFLFTCKLTQNDQLEPTLFLQIKFKYFVNGKELFGL